MDNRPKLDLTEDDYERIQKSQIVAMDTEMGGLNPQRDHLYLIQICDRNGVIDVLQNDNWKSAINLQKVLRDHEILKVFHFAIMDCAFLLQKIGVVPQGVYCTKLASKLARTYASSHSLKSLVEEFLGFELDKKQQSSFWGTRPLTEDQLEYSINDVKHIMKIKSSLDSILAQKGSLPTGISYVELNNQIQAFIPTLVHLWVNGWDFGKEDQSNIFGR